MFNFRAIFSPADLIISKATTYTDTDPATLAKLNFLHDFLANIVSYIAFDDNSQKTFKDIEDSVKKVMDMEKLLAKKLIENGHEDVVKERKFDTKQFNELSGIVTVVSLP